MTGVWQELEGLTVLGLVGFGIYRASEKGKAEAAVRAKEFAAAKAEYSAEDYQRFADAMLDELIDRTSAEGLAVDLLGFTSGQPYARSKAAEHHLGQVRDRLLRSRYVVAAEPPVAAADAFAEPADGQWYALTAVGFSLLQARLHSDVRPTITFTNVTNASVGNVASPGATARTAQRAQVGLDAAAFLRLAEALRTDSVSAAGPNERRKAYELADEVQAVAADPQAPGSRAVADKVKVFLEVAQSAFTLTKDIIAQFFH